MRRILNRTQLLIKNEIYVATVMALISMNRYYLKLNHMVKSNDGSIQSSNAAVYE